MASSLLALLDDITTVLDDVAVLSKVAAKKTSGVLGDDLALNAQQVAGVQAERELPVVWAVAKGSLKNKAILVPAALALSAAAPWAVTPLLMFGGLFLCYEGFEKLAHRFLRTRAELEKEHAALVQAVADPKVDMVAFEKEKISGAVRTDFILSAEIIAITLGAVAGKEFVVRAGVLLSMALLITVAVYGLVAAVVKLDDLGQDLSRRRGSAALGRGILAAAPLLMKALSVLGTAAMFMVGGGILAHGVPGLHERVHAFAHHAGPLSFAVSSGADLLVGVLAGALAVAAHHGAAKLRR
jgi:predicted DNA repair protein MutK